MNGIATYNIGVGGYTCNNVFEESSLFIDTFNPEQIVLVCGENDLFEYSVEETFENYQNVVLAYINSGAKVVSISTKPEPSTTSLHSKYRTLDNLIKDWAATDLSPTDFVFIDAYYGFTDLGNSNHLYDSDGLHLSTLGYSYWEAWLNIALEDTNNSCQLWRSGECVSSYEYIPPNSNNGCDDRPTTSMWFKFRITNIQITMVVVIIIIIV